VMRALGVFVGAIWICAAQDAPYRAGNGVSAPVPVQKSEPAYTAEARQAGVDGTVRVSLVVDSEGNSTNLKVARPIGFGLDEAALRTVAEWKFKPGVKDGVPVPVQTTIEVNFALPERRDTLHMQSFACQLPEAAARPIVLKTEHPAPPGLDETVSVTISMDVDQQGVPTNLHLVKLSDPKREEDVIRALREWRFRPGVPPVVTPCTLSFLIGKKPESSNAYHVGNISPPQVVTKVEPQYSEEARRVGYEGKVVVSVVVDPSGRARDLKVLRPLGLGLDEAALAAVREWTFQPGMKDGQPVAVQATIEVNFRLLDKAGSGGWHVDSITFRPPDGAERPHLTGSKFPKPSEGAHAFVVVSFDVDEKGKPANLRADQVSDEKWQGEVLDGVKGWRFEPGMKDGAPVVVPCTVRIAIGR
jgi:TonB family protein